MAKINPFYKIHRSTPISQFVEQKLPLELVQGNLAAKQTKQDELGAKYDEAGLWDQKYITERDKAGVNKLKKHIDTVVDRWSNADRTTGEAAKDLANLNKMLRDSEELKVIKANKAWHDQFEEDTRKLALEGDAAWWREQQKKRAIAEYEARGKTTTADDRIAQIAQVKELDTRAAREKYTDNIKADLTETYGQGAVDEIKFWLETGTEKISNERIKRDLEANVAEYINTNAGRQDIEIFQENVFAVTGGYPDAKQIKDYMTALMFNTGKERVFKRVTSNIKNFPGDGSGKVPKEEYGGLYTFQGGVGDVSVDWKKETERYDANKKQIKVLETKLSGLQKKYKEKGWDALTDDEKKQYNDLNAEYLGLKENQRVYEQMFANAHKEIDKTVFAKDHYMSDLPDNPLPNAPDYKERAQLAIKQGKGWMQFMTDPANADLAKAFEATVGQDHHGDIANSYLAAQKEYNEAWEKVVAEGKVVQPANMLFGDAGTKVAKATKALNDAFKTGAIDWVTTTGAQNSADPDLRAEMPTGVETARWTGEVTQGKPVILMTYKGTDGTTRAKQVVLGNNASSRQITLTLARELIDDGNKAGNKLIADLGHSIAGYHLPPTRVVDQTKQARGSLGQQLYAGKQYVNRGDSFNVLANDTKFRIRRSDTDKEQWQVYQMVNGKEVNVVEVISGYEAEQAGTTRASKAKYLDNFKDITAYINKLVVLSQELNKKKTKP